MKKVTFKAVNASDAGLNQNSPPVLPPPPVFTPVHHEVAIDVHSADYESVQRHRQFMTTVLDQQVASDCTVYFRVPVSAELYPDYRVKIAHPMDLGTMKQQLDSGVYDSCDITKDGQGVVGLEQFFHDLDLIIGNAKIYNAKQMLPHVYATKMDVQLQGRRKQQRMFLKMVLDSHGVSGRSVSSISSGGNTISSGGSSISSSNVGGGSIGGNSSVNAMLPASSNLMRPQSSSTSAFPLNAGIPPLVLKPLSDIPAEVAVQSKKKKKAVVAVAIKHTVPCRRTLTLYVNRLQHIQQNAYAYRAYIESKTPDAMVTSENIKYSQGLYLFPPAIKAAVVVSLFKQQEALRLSSVPNQRYKSRDVTINTQSGNVLGKQANRPLINVKLALPKKNIGQGMMQSATIVPTKEPARVVIPKTTNIINQEEEKSSKQESTSAVIVMCSITLPAYGCTTSIIKDDDDDDSSDDDDNMNDDNNNTNKRRRVDSSVAHTVPSIEYAATTATTPYPHLTPVLPSSTFLTYGFLAHGEDLFYRGSSRALTLYTHSREVSFTHSCMYVLNPSFTSASLQLTFSATKPLAGTQFAEIDSFVSSLETTSVLERNALQQDRTVFLSEPVTASLTHRAGSSATSASANELLTHLLPYNGTFYSSSLGIIVSIVQYTTPCQDRVGIVFKRSQYTKPLSMPNFTLLHPPMHNTPTDTNLPQFPTCTRIPCAAIHVFQLPKSNDMFLNGIKLDTTKHGVMLLQPHLEIQNELFAAKQRDKRIREMQSNRDARERALMTVLVPQIEALTKDMNKKV